MTAWSRTVASHLSDAGLLIERTSGPVVVDGWALTTPERTIQLAGAVDEAALEAVNAGTRWFAAIVKRRMKHAREAYVVMPHWQFIEVVKLLLGIKREPCPHCGKAAA
jgi:hypothetical protein